MIRFNSLQLVALQRAMIRQMAVELRREAAGKTCGCCAKLGPGQCSERYGWDDRPLRVLRPSAVARDRWEARP